MEKSKCTESEMVKSIALPFFDHLSTFLSLVFPLTTAYLQINKE